MGVNHEVIEFIKQIRNSRNKRDEERTLTRAKASLNKSDYARLLLWSGTAARESKAK